MDEEQAKKAIFKIFEALYDQVMEPETAMEQFEELVGEL